MWTVKIVETYSGDASPPPHGELAPSSGTTKTGLHARRRYRQFREQSAFPPTRKKGRGWHPS